MTHCTSRTLITLASSAHSLAMSQDEKIPANFPDTFCTTAWWILRFCRISAASSRLISGVAGYKVVLITSFTSVSRGVCV